MPQCFLTSFGHQVAVILNFLCIYRPTFEFISNGLTWSSCKHYKFFISSLKGTVSYVLEAMGGGGGGGGEDVSDKHSTENCGILKWLLPKDIVLADRGFNIASTFLA